MLHRMICPPCSACPLTGGIGPLLAPNGGGRQIDTKASARLRQELAASRVRFERVRERHEGRSSGALRQNSVTLLHGLLTVLDFARQFEFTSLQQGVPSLKGFSVQVGEIARDCDRLREQIPVWLRSSRQWSATIAARYCWSKPENWSAFSPSVTC